MMRALDTEVVDAVFAAVEGLIPSPKVSHPLGCHRRRISDRLCFQGILIRLVTGCSWEDTERLLSHQVSDTTLRSRRDEWIAAGVFDRLFSEAVAAYDKIVGLDLSEVCIDGAQAKARCGGEGTGRNPADRGKTGWKWSIAVEATGVPIAWVVAPANRHDSKLIEPTLAAVTQRGLHHDIETVHLDKGYDYRFVDDLIAKAGIDDANISRKKKPNEPDPIKRPYRIDRRWVVERTNSWFEAFGQLRRNTDRKSTHRAAQLALAIVMLITARLIDWRNRYNPQPCPIR
jgi:transposase